MMETHFSTLKRVAAMDEVANMEAPEEGEEKEILEKISNKEIEEIELAQFEMFQNF
jgi:hypothetical protein